MERSEKDLEKNSAVKLPKCFVTDSTYVIYSDAASTKFLFVYDKPYLHWACIESIIHDTIYYIALLNQQVNSSDM